jgi:hypothetical protein
MGGGENFSSMSFLNRRTSALARYFVPPFFGEILNPTCQDVISAASEIKEGRCLQYEGK